jgi:hypothetical protein
MPKILAAVVLVAGLLAFLPLARAALRADAAERPAPAPPGERVTRGGGRSGAYEHYEKIQKSVDRSLEDKQRQKQAKYTASHGSRSTGSDAGDDDDHDDDGGASEGAVLRPLNQHVH